MARTMNQDGTCYRAYIEYERTNPNNGEVTRRTVYFGPYAEIGPAKAARTIWLSRSYNTRNTLILNKGVQISDTWREV